MKKLFHKLLDISPTDRNALLISMVLFMLFVILLIAIAFAWRARLWRFVDLTQEAKYKAAELSPIALISVDDDGIVFMWNRRAFEIFGYTEAEMLNKSVTKIVDEPFKEKLLDTLHTMRLTSEVISKKILEEVGVTKDGTKINIEVKVSRWSLRHEVFATIAVRDITERKALEETMLRELKLYQEGEHLLCTGAWRWDVIRDVIWATRGHHIMRGFQQAPDTRDVVMSIHYQDLPLVNAAIAKAIETGEGYDIEYRIVPYNKPVIKVRGIARTETDLEGKVTYLYGANIVKEVCDAG